MVAHREGGVVLDLGNNGENVLAMNRRGVTDARAYTLRQSSPALWHGTRHAARQKKDRERRPNGTGRDEDVGEYVPGKSLREYEKGVTLLEFPQIFEGIISSWTGAFFVLLVLEFGFHLF